MYINIKLDHIDIRTTNKIFLYFFWNKFPTTATCSQLSNILPINNIYHNLSHDTDDDGIEEAMRRKAELDADPSIGMSLEEVNAELDKLACD